MAGAGWPLRLTTAGKEVQAGKAYAAIHFAPILMGPGTSQRLRSGAKRHSRSRAWHVPVFVRRDGIPPPSIAGKAHDRAYARTERFGISGNRRLGRESNSSTEIRHCPPQEASRSPHGRFSFHVRPPVASGKRLADWRKRAKVQRPLGNLNFSARQFEGCPFDAPKTAT